MIVQLLPNRRQDTLHLKLNTHSPVGGTLCRMHWQMLQENPALPHRFYRIDNTGLCKISGGRALLLGHAQDAEEFGAFLRFSQVLQLTTSNPPPPGWKVVEKSRVLLRPSNRILPAFIEHKEVKGFSKTVSPSDILTLLESSDGPIPPAARDYFYADLCARRNHGHAILYGILQNNALLSTAGIWALLEHEGYLANVETHFSHRNQGYASFLLSQLCHDFGSTHSLSLLCQEPLIAFYSRFGFAPTEEYSFVSITQ